MGFLFLLLQGVVFFTLIAVALSLRLLDDGLSLNCTQEEVPCKAVFNNCLYRGWLIPSDFTPSEPDDLQVDVDVRRNMKGDLEPWSFFLDAVVVDPDRTYVVTVSNLPKPNLKHSSYNVHTNVDVPGCDHPSMISTTVCIERGETWQPNISVVRTRGLDVVDGLYVQFFPGENVERYNIFMKCNRDSSMKTLYHENQTLLNVTFDLENWSRSCCEFNVQIQPFFKNCANDCRRRNLSFNICDPVAEKPPTKPLLETPFPHGQRSVLIIYSKDHPLYTEMVLKLCAFLRAKCGTDVVLDLLDTAWLGTIGRMQWIEQKKRYIEQSSNKILILCSRGVQAKWGAICGEPRVLLREDVRSPVGDMLTLALQLITPDMQRPASYGKYLVAFFDDVSSERDVPSLFDIAVKYRLMKHFEELYFRILDVEKYEPGVERCIKDIGMDEYFNCPSGEALKTAIEAFQLHQIKNPNWFEKECVNSEDEVRGETDPLLKQPIAPIYEKTAIINNGPPILIQDVNIRSGTPSICTVTPQIHNNPEQSVMVVSPRVHSKPGEVLSSHPALAYPIEMPSVVPVNPLLYPCLQVESLPVETACPPVVFPVGEPSDLCLGNNRKNPTAPPPSMEDSFLLDQEMNMSAPVEMEESEMEGASEMRPSRGSDQGYSSRNSVDKEELKLQLDLSLLTKLQTQLLLNSPISSGFYNNSTES
ncbi:hypothetical protein DNTS_015080 [Danionella cerebrum]|uniref:SEFIR domain-containing protein n=1 Tax=Danionella cerebrum TaxID=2873325 RepID=A0A553RNX4_9TELE|nr:hypothetical protein DNTS_015080 [Danionella translucida]